MNEKKDRQLLFSLTKKDFEFQYYKGSGAGGQNRNKVETGVRIIHKDSGARAEYCRERSREQNKKHAFLNLLKTDKFTKWHRIKCAQAMGNMKTLEEIVEEQLSPENIKIEYYDEEEKKWKIEGN